MNIVEVAKKMEKLLCNETIYFDYSSYEHMDDIPCVFIHGKRWNVYSIKLENDSIELMIDNGDDGRIVTKYYYKPDKIRTREVINDECKDLGMYNLLMDTYYETPYSYDIGDFETDFLGL
jgi:hypothetical protein